MLKRIYALITKYPLTVMSTVLLTVGIAVIQIGGLLEKLFGKKKPSTDVRVLPPVNRVDSNGDPIPIGQSDNNGYIQSPIDVKIKDAGIFSNPDTITVIHPDKGEVILPLPVGVKNKDISEVVEVQPNVYQLKNNDSGVDTSELRNILK